MENALVLSKSAEIARIEIDSAIATAQQYPRDEVKIIKKIELLCTIDDETASECFYVKPVGSSSKKLSRSGKKDELSKNLTDPDSLDEKFVIGESIRFAEICISQWRHIKIRTYIKEVAEKTITAVAEAIDMETNVSVSTEVSKSIYGSNGRYSATTIENTKQAAQSIAYRNAAFKLIPKALFKNVLTNIKKMSIGLKEKTSNVKEVTLESARSNAVKFFLKQGITEEQILNVLEVNNISEITDQHIIILRGFKTSIAEKLETLESIFSPVPEFKEIPNGNLKRNSDDQQVNLFENEKI